MCKLFFDRGCSFAVVNLDDIGLTEHGVPFYLFAFIDHGLEFWGIIAMRQFLLGSLLHVFSNKNFLASTITHFKQMIAS